MPIVFVHGVNNRKSPSYDARTLATEAFLKKHLEGASIDGKALASIPQVWFPYWGDLATSFAWEMDSLPRGEMQALGSAADPELGPLVAHIREGLPGAMGPEPLAQLAQRDFPSAVDIVVHLALDHAEAGKAREAASFAVEASAYADANPSPTWLSSVTTDAQFLALLNAELVAPTGTESLGGFGSIFSAITVAATKLKSAVLGLPGKVADKAGDFASTKLLAASRESLNATLGRFFGDIFVYFNGRGDAADPGPIPQRVLDAFDEALQQRPDSEPFVIIGHSLGGVITFDLLSHFRPDLEVDLFVSVGSQVAHFEEMKLYRASDRAVRRPARAPRPAAIKHWINIYDEVDIFAYAADRVFDGVDVDGRYDTGTYVIKAHGAYFEQNRFYERLRARIDAL